MIELRFQPRWRAAVLAGAKTTTVRTKRCGAAGDAFELDGARFRILAVDAMPLDRARDACWESEGFASPAEFEAEWVRNHPNRGFRASDSVWVHRFERVP